MAKFNDDDIERRSEAEESIYNQARRTLPTIDRFRDSIQFDDENEEKIFDDLTLELRDACDEYEESKEYLTPEGFQDRAKSATRMSELLDQIRDYTKEFESEMDA